MVRWILTPITLLCASIKGTKEWVYIKKRVNKKRKRKCLQKVKGSQVVTGNSLKNTHDQLFLEGSARKTTFFYLKN